MQRGLAFGSFQPSSRVMSSLESGESNVKVISTLFPDCIAPFLMVHPLRLVQVSVGHVGRQEALARR